MSAKYLQNALARRTRIIVTQQDDPLKAMRELEKAAHSACLLTGEARWEGTTPTEFADYLWLANPMATIWLETRARPIRRPQLIRNLSDLMDVLRS